MLFRPFVVDAKSGENIYVEIVEASEADIAATSKDSKWQTDWSSNYLNSSGIDKFAIKSKEGELIGLGAYEIRGKQTYVFILYAESAPHSNPTMHARRDRKYYGMIDCLSQME